MSRDATSRQEALRLREERRIRLHEVVGELVADLDTKIDEAWLLIPIMAKMSMNDLVEFNDTDTGKAMREREVRIKRAIVELGLSVRDAGLRQRLIDLEKTLIDWPDRAMDPVTKVENAGIDAVSEGYAHVRLTNRAMREFRNEATLLLAVNLEEGPAASAVWRRVWSWLRLKVSGLIARDYA